VDAETGFLIDGKVYGIPSWDSLNLNEEEVLYDLCGLVQEDFMPAEGESDEEHEERLTGLMKRPKFWAALMQIAYQRGNPDAKPGDVKLVIGKTNRLDAMSAMGKPEKETPEGPLASTSEPNESSPSGSLENENSARPSPENSGSDATNGSAEADVRPTNTTTTRLVTSSISAREISAA
jgi:hypothetical protein